MGRRVSNCIRIIMAEEIKTAQATTPPAPPKSNTAPKPASVSKNVKLILTGAGSFSGLGLNHVLKGQEVTVDSAKADKLVAMGLFKKA